MNVIDLQMHSNFSDGALSPEELLFECAKASLKIVSVTDHDTVDHVTISIEAGQRHGIKVISGMELSVAFGDKELHMLGYNFDHADPALRDRLAFYAAARRHRAETAAAKLHDAGFTINFTDIRKIAGGSIGRPHIAQAVLNRTENATKLSGLGITNFSQFIEAYLEVGTPGYVKREKFPAVEAIALIHGAGGITVLAHPGWTFRKDFGNIPGVLAELKKLGLDGVESFYRTHSAEQTAMLHEAARKLDLYETSGSDFHNPGNELFGQLGAWENFGLKPNYPAFVSG